MRVLFCPASCAPAPVPLRKCFGRNTHARSGRKPFASRWVPPGSRASAAATSIDPEILFQMTSQHNNVLVIEFPPSFPDGEPIAGSRALILDPTNNIHSLFREDRVLLGESLYWQHLALIAEVAPEGPIGILGLGAGTVARVIHHFWPEREMHGWELDDVVLFAGRTHMGLQAVESQGSLRCHVGDALDPAAAVEGGFAGIVVDLFARGDVIKPLEQVETWREIKAKLRPGGVCIANLGFSEAAVRCMGDVFSDVQIKRPERSRNALGLSGGVPSGVAQRLPPELRHAAEDWEPLP